MRRIDDAFYRAKIQQKLQLAQMVHVAHLRLERLFEQATWRLNEAEAALPATRHAIGYGSISMLYPYGQRLPNQERIYDQEEYANSLPPEHRGNKHHMVTMSWDMGEYFASDYLRRVASRESFYKLYKRDWLGRWARK